MEYYCIYVPPYLLEKRLVLQATAEAISARLLAIVVYRHNRHERGYLQ